MFFALFLAACSASDFALVSAGSPDLADGPIVCEFPATDSKGNETGEDTAPLDNQLLLEKVESSETSVIADEFSELARYRVSLIHPECPGLTLGSSDMNVEGSDENHVRWWEDLNAGGVTVFNITTGESLGVSGNGEQVLSESERGDGFNWAHTFSSDLYISPEDEFEFVIVADTSGASSGVASEYQDVVFVRFGWFVVSDGLNEAWKMPTNYSGNVLTIL